MENFVFHEEYIIDIPKDKLSEFLNYIVQYGLYNKTPDLDGFELVYWKTIQRRIDTDKNFYEITCLKRKINAINVRVHNNKATENDLKNLSEYTTKLNELNSVKRDISFKTKLNELNEQNEVKLPHYDIDSDFDTDIDSDIDIDTDTEGNEMPVKESQSMINYSKEIFILFRDANLPCSRSNEISFLQTDFTNALNYLHKTPEFAHIHSDDVIGAVKNYIEVLQDPECYVSNKMNFFSLVKSKNFYNFLPSNFDPENFKNFGARDNKKTESAEDRYKDYEKIYISKPCKKCKGTRIFLNPNIRQWICDDCFAMYPFTSYQGDK